MNIGFNFTPSLSGALAPTPIVPNIPKQLLKILEDSRSNHYVHASLSRDPGSAPGQLNLMQKGQVRGVWG